MPIHTALVWRVSSRAQSSQETQISGFAKGAAGIRIPKGKNKSSSPLSSLFGVQKYFQGLTQDDDKRNRAVPTARQGSLTNSSNAVRNFLFESAIIGANERVRPHAETEDSS